MSGTIDRFVERTPRLQAAAAASSAAGGDGNGAAAAAPRPIAVVAVRLIKDGLINLDEAYRTSRWAVPSLHQGQLAAWFDQFQLYLLFVCSNEVRALAYMTGPPTREAELGVFTHLWANHKRYGDRFTLEWVLFEAALMPRLLIDCVYGDDKHAPIALLTTTEGAPIVKHFIESRQNPQTVTPTLSRHMHVLRAFYEQYVIETGVFTSSATAASSSSSSYQPAVQPRKPPARIGPRACALDSRIREKSAKQLKDEALAQEMLKWKRVTSLDRFVEPLQSPQSKPRLHEPSADD